MLVLASAAGRAGTDGADVFVDVWDVGAADGGADVAVVVGVDDGADDTAAVAPARSQGFGGEGIGGEAGDERRVQDRRWSGYARTSRRAPRKFRFWVWQVPDMQPFWESRRQWPRVAREHPQPAADHSNGRRRHCMHTTATTARLAAHSILHRPPVCAGFIL